MAAISGLQVRFGRRYRPGWRPSVRIRAHSCPQLLQLRAPYHAQFAQLEQRVQLRSVLGQPAVAHLHMPELALDHPERVSDLSQDSGLDLFQLVKCRAHRRFLVQHLSLARLSPRASSR